MKQKLAEWINIIFGFRKFLVMLIVFIIGVIFRLKGLISGSEMVDMFKAISISFFGANTVEHIVATVQGYVASKDAQRASQVADTDESNDDKEVTPVVES